MLELKMEDYVEMVQNKDRDSFGKQLGVAVLVAELEDESADVFQNASTSVMDPKVLKGKLRSPKEEAEMHMSLTVLELRSQTSPDSELITLGRAEENDVIILDDTISSCHAEFTQKAGGNAVLITDLNSRNGVYVNGEKIDPQKALKLSNKDLLGFGDAKFVFFSPRGLYDELKSILKKVETDIASSRG
jgi:hypothetical protein